MSDVSQGAGWWIASDRKWYPPHLHPSASYFPAAPPYPSGYGPPPSSPLSWHYQDPRANIDVLLNLNLAPWWKRFVAILVDVAILAVFYVVILMVIAALSHDSNTSPTTPTPAASIIAGLALLFVLLQLPAVLYYGIMNGSKRGQTLGKMAMGIAVRDARTGGPIGFWRGIGRFAISFVFDVILLIPYLIDSLSPLWSSRRQAWHDRVVHSVVIDLRP
jgi:uncharacterized RDD family membrane protein YckC